MRYVIIWMLCLGVAFGLADKDDMAAANENPVAVIIFAPMLAMFEVIQLFIEGEGK